LSKLHCLCSEEFFGNNSELKTELFGNNSELKTMKNQSTFHGVGAKFFNMVIKKAFNMS